MHDCPRWYNLTNYSAQETDEHIKAIKEILQNKLYDDYLIKNNVLCKCISSNDLLVVPEETQKKFN